MMNLTKGENFSLEKEAPGITKFTLGLGWDAGNNFDLDASVLIKNAEGNILNGDEKNVIYFKNLTSPCGSIVHSGDNRTGEGEGDDESISIDFTKIPAEVSKVSVVVNIYQAEERGQNFGQVNNAFARVYETESGNEIAKYDLTEDYSAAYAILVCEFYLHNGAWKFKALGEGSKNNLATYIREAGIAA